MAFTDIISQPPWLLNDKGIVQGSSQLLPAPGAPKSTPDQPAVTGNPNQNNPKP